VHVCTSSAKPLNTLPIEGAVSQGDGQVIRSKAQRRSR
jgi:hypothetical protein